MTDLAARSRASHAPVLSICLPVFNESGLVPELLDRLQKMLRELGVSSEVIFADDGSVDRTLELLDARRRTFPELRILSLSRNFGHQQACTAALEAATGQAIVMMDSDLQDPPELIPELYAKWREGFDVVYAQRRRRDESASRKLAFWCYHRVFRLAAGRQVPVDTGQFSLLDRRVARVLASLRERHRYFPGLRAWAGFRQTSVLFDRPNRPDDKPKVRFSQLVRLGIDGIISFSMLPLRVASLTGLLLAGAAVVAIPILLVVRLLGYQLGQPGWTSLVLLNLLLGGLILLCLGIIGEYVGRIYEETKQRPYYLVKDRLGFPGDADPDPAPDVVVSERA
jgi:dolichol-phosphate mannosyltransferase